MPPFCKEFCLEVSVAHPWNKNKGPSVLKAPAFTAAFRVDEKKCLLKKPPSWQVIVFVTLFGMVICDPFKGWKGDLQPLGIKSRSWLWITTCEWRFLLNRECSWVIFLTKLWVWHQDQRVARTDQRVKNIWTSLNQNICVWQAGSNIGYINQWVNHIQRDSPPNWEVPWFLGVIQAIQAVTFFFIPKTLEVTFPTSERLTWTHHPKKVTKQTRQDFGGLGSSIFFPAILFWVQTCPNTVIGAADGHQIVFFDGETWAFSSEVLSDSWWFSWILGFEYPILDEVFTVTSAILGLELESLFFFLVQVHVFFSPQKTIRVAKI